MNLPTLQGVIRRRLLVNYRADPQVVQKLLPAPFRPKLHDGQAIVGICLIRLEHIRPVHVPEFLGINSENAAHRIAVVWDDQEGVFIPRRDTDSTLNHLAGGRIFPGEHHRADFQVRWDGAHIDFQMRSRDGEVAVQLQGDVALELPPGSCFAGLAAASNFFQPGSLGYSATRSGRSLDGITLHTNKWHMEPLELQSVHSSFYTNRSLFPEGSIHFDHALLMRDLEHQWKSAPPLLLQ